MKPINKALIKRYLMIYKKNPRSKVFALLADLYRKKGEIDKALKLCQNGLKEHPEFSLGHIALALSLLDMNKLEMAAESLEKAIEFSPENIFAYKTLGQIWLKLKNPEKTLKAYKMLLFLDPENKTAKNIIKKLEPTTSVQYDKTGFTFKSLKEVAQYISPVDKKPKETPTLHPLPKSFSKREKQQFFARKEMVEALIYRKEFLKASEFIREMKNIYHHQQWKEHIQALEKKLPHENEAGDNQAGDNQAGDNQAGDKKPFLKPVELKPFREKTYTSSISKALLEEKGEQSISSGKANLALLQTIKENTALTKTHVSKSRKKQEKIQTLRKLLARIEQSQITQ